MIKSYHPLLLALCGSLVACGHSYDHHHGGNVVIGGGGGPAQEVEPNDHVENANYLGSVRAGDFIQIEGHITECCGDDYDGFAFYALEPVSVRITLHEANPFADLDFAIYIPEINDFVAAWETDNHPEFGIYDQGGVGEFHIVVDSWIGDSNYLLDVDFQPLFPALTAGGGDGPQESAPSAFSIERFEGYRAPDRSEGLPVRIELRSLEPAPEAQAPTSEPPAQD